MVSDLATTQLTAETVSCGQVLSRRRSPSVGLCYSEGCRNTWCLSSTSVHMEGRLYPLTQLPSPGCSSRATRGSVCAQGPVCTTTESCTLTSFLSVRGVSVLTALTSPPQVQAWCDLQSEQCRRTVAHCKCSLCGNRIIQSF